MKAYLPISIVISVASLAVPQALGQHAQADLDNMPIFGMPADRKGTGGGIGNTGIPGIPHGPYLGIETQDIAAGRTGVPEPHGVKVTQVEAGSPASKAGFEIGDVVLDYQGRAVWDKARLSELLSPISVGHQVRFGVWRSGARLTLTATLEAIVVHPDSWPTLISKVEPKLTPQAQKAGILGPVLAYVLIGTDGRAHHVRVANGLGYGLDARAMEAVAQWRFSPGKKNGVPVIVPDTIEVNFRRP